jgi:hypothetical protein
MIHDGKTLSNTKNFVFETGLPFVLFVLLPCDGGVNASTVARAQASTDTSHAAGPIALQVVAGNHTIGVRDVRRQRRARRSAYQNKETSHASCSIPIFEAR